MGDIMISEGGMALDAQGNPADMPRKTAHAISAELFGVLTLIRASISELDEIDDHHTGADEYGHTSSVSRAAALADMASDKVHALLGRVAPFV